MDFLGKKNQDSKETVVPVEMHIPTNGQKIPEVVQEQPRPKVEDLESKSLEEEKGFDDQIDLSESERRKIKLKKFFKKVGLGLFLILLVVSAVYGGLNLLNTDQDIVVRPPVVELPLAENPTEPIPEIPKTPEVPNIEDVETVLPDTALAPLRGALVRISVNPTIYLVENNGELRKVDELTTVFENQKTITNISKSLIYTLPDKWIDIRKGRDVGGQVDWDPRVLKISELLPFVQ